MVFRVLNFAFGLNQPLGQCAFRDQECSNDFRICQTTQCSESEHNLGLQTQCWMTTGENQLRPVLSHGRLVKIRNPNEVVIISDQWAALPDRNFASVARHSIASRERFTNSTRHGSLHPTDDWTPGDSI